MEEKFENAIKQFNLYYGKFDDSVLRIHKKYDHTFRVVEYATRIAKSENLNEHDSYLAFVCALLHDIARFKQFTEHQTYDDGVSFNHGEMGYKILLENDYVSKYVESEEDKQIVLKAVKNHNKFSFEDNLNERELYFARLTKDADKLDIMFKQGNELLDGEISFPDECINAVLEKRLVDRSKSGWNSVIRVFVTMCFVFERYFEESKVLIKEENVIETKLSLIEPLVDKDTFIKIKQNIYEQLM